LLVAVRCRRIHELEWLSSLVSSATLVGGANPRMRQ
jgi:hypothetical protein